MSRVLSLLLLIPFFATAAPAQRLTDLPSGSVIRVTRIRESGVLVRFEAALDTVQRDSIRFTHALDGVASTWSLAEVRRLDVERTRTWGEGARRGFATGTLVMGTVTALVWVVARQRDRHQHDVWLSNADATLLLGLPATVLTGLVTALVQGGQTRVWARVEMPAR